MDARELMEWRAFEMVEGPILVHDRILGWANAPPFEESLPQASQPEPPKPESAEAMIAKIRRLQRRKRKKGG